MVKEHILHMYTDSPTNLVRNYIKPYKIYSLHSWRYFVA